ncbi:MAG: hypothetical protein D6683_05590 [Actinomyces sp.]|nr:MAG: hypothetical protein D6683_05590 [Actinomyces sp.]
MSAVRRTVIGTGIAALAGLGVALVLESTGVIDGSWRDKVADLVASVAFPEWTPWQSTLAGLGAAVVGLVAATAQLMPAKKGLHTMHEVSRGDDGDTLIRGRAAIAAARHEVQGIDGVVAVDATIRRKAMTVEVQVDDRVDLAEVEHEVRARLDTPFWIDLGLADFAVDILITHHPRPPRVR